MLCTRQKALKSSCCLHLLRCAMQALFEQAIADKTSQHFPLLWRCYMSYEICRGRHEAARRVLLRAVHTCPGAKALWLDGLHFLAEQVMQFSWTSALGSFRTVFRHRSSVKCISCHAHVVIQCVCVCVCVNTPAATTQKIFKSL